MSRFRQSRRERPLEQPRPLGVAQPAGNLVPMTAEEFARLKRRKALKWGIPGLVAAVALGAFLYRFTLPVDAQNSYIDAQKLYDTGKYADALATVSRAVRDRSQRVRALQLRATIYQALHRPEDALADLGKLIELRPRDPGNYRGRAQMYLDAGHTDKALDDYTRLIEIENAAEDYNGRGICYMKLNLPQRAIEDFTKALERKPAVESFLQRGLALASTGDHRRAIEDYNSALELAPGSSAVYRARAASFVAMGDNAAAERDRAKAMGIEKPQPPILEQVTVPKSR